MAGRKKLGNDPLKRRKPVDGDCLPAGTRPASLENLLAPCPDEGEAASSPPASSPSPASAVDSFQEDHADALQAALQQLFPPVIPPRKNGRDAQWLYVAEEQFRRMTMAVPTIYGRSAFSPAQFRDAATLLARELLYTRKQDPAVLPLTHLPASTNFTIPRATALLLLYGLFATMYCLQDKAKLGKGVALQVAVEHLPDDIGGPAVALCCLEPGDEENGVDEDKRLLHRARLWPCLEQLGFKLARYGCRLLMYSHEGAELRLYAPITTSLLSHNKDAD